MKDQGRRFREAIKIFVSFTEPDAALALSLHEVLKQSGFSVWNYKRDEQPGEAISEAIYGQIEECDFFCVIASQHSASAPYVQIELSIAYGLLRARNDHRPRIFGVRPVVTDSVPSIPLRFIDDWKQQQTDCQLSGEQFDFAELNTPAIDPSDEQSIADLIEWLTPKIRFFGDDIKSTEELFEICAFETYEALFPNPEERDDVHDICMWLESESHRGRVVRRSLWRIINPRTILVRIRRAGGWGSVMGVFQVGGRAVGFVYLSVHLSTGWIFGNYFGLLASWRSSGRAKIFVEEIEHFVSAHFIHAKAIVFEVEVFDEKTLVVIKGKVQSGNLDFTSTELEQIRAIKRVSLYLGSGKSYLLVGSRTKRPLTYKQPAMSLPEPDENVTLGQLPAWLRAKEWPLWIMVRPIERKGPVRYKVAEVFRFVYIDLFAKSYDPVLKLKGFSYLKYVRALRASMTASNDAIAEGSRIVPMGGKEIWSLILNSKMKIPL